MKAFICFALLLYATFVYAEDLTCLKANEHESMCDVASELVSKIKPHLPIKLDELTYITDVKAKNNFIVFSATLAYTRNKLNDTMKVTGATLFDIQSHINTTFYLHACNGVALPKYFKAGGFFKYEISLYENDPFFVVNVFSCPQ